MSIMWWGDLSQDQRDAFIWMNNQQGGSGTRGPSGQTDLDDRIYTSSDVNYATSAYGDYQRKQAEIARIKAETEKVEETARQDTEKARRYSEYQASKEQRSSGGNKSMLSAATGFAKIRRKVLGSAGELGSTDEKLGG